MIAVLVLLPHAACIYVTKVTDFDFLSPAIKMYTGRLEKELQQWRR